MLTNVTVILFEEVLGPYKTEHFGTVFAANLSWILVPIVVIARMWLQPHPFVARQASRAELATAPIVS